MGFDSTQQSQHHSKIRKCKRDDRTWSFNDLPTRAFPREWWSEVEDEDFRSSEVIAKPLGCRESAEKLERRDCLEIRFSSSERIFTIGFYMLCGLGLVTTGLQGGYLTVSCVSRAEGSVQEWFRLKQGLVCTLRKQMEQVLYKLKTVFEWTLN
ncbi:unnamed protein product [Vicia faba]|uniref:Uncharacterized protein n=1 Tax=Vicia faba TaxID=3906 RepID=A0AAV0YGH8_VICFA|nr:unnamed protein product [Vicia faba]